MKKLLSILLFTIAFNGFSQESILTSVVSHKEFFPMAWTEYVDNQFFSIEYKAINCQPNSGYDFQSVIFRITNKTNSQLDFSWFIDLYYNQVCKTCNHPLEYKRIVSIPPNSTLTGECDRQSDIALKMFSKFNDPNYTKGEHLTGFKLETLTVSGI